MAGYFAGTLWQIAGQASCSERNTSRSCFNLSYKGGCARDTLTGQDCLTEGSLVSQTRRADVVREKQTQIVV